MYSLQSRLLRILRQLLRKEKDVVKLTPAGLEHWSSSSAGKLLTREANVAWLIEKFKGNGLRVRKRVSGQFTEAYTRVSSTLIKHIIHRFNTLWFTYIRIPSPAVANIMILQKVSKAISGKAGPLMPSSPRSTSSSSPMPSTPARQYL